MIPYSRDPKQVIPTSAVKIIGLGGAGANMLERVALDGMEGAELLALNTDIRTLASCIAREKIQLGINLTKGLGTGGDPELGNQAVLEAEDAIREVVKGRRIVFLCTGLGGGTGSGAAPIVTRIAREEGAFVVVFATMPFAFEGKRRRDQAEAALNELAVLSNALVTFDNNRMGELVLAKQGIHEAFIAADHMICESIKAVIRLVIRPGLINVGLDDLMSALRTNRSRCLFGSGLASGKDRSSRALQNALASPLLDQGSLLKEAQTVLVHLCGGEDLTLFEIELLMQKLQKYVPDQAHVLFGAAIDPAMGDSLSLTLISALPEDSLAMAPRESLSRASVASPLLDPSQGFTPPERKKTIAPELVAAFEPEPEPEPKPAPVVKKAEPASPAKPAAESGSSFSKFRRAITGAAAAPTLFDEDRPFAEPEIPAAAKPKPAPEPEPELEAFDFTAKSKPAPTKEFDDEPEEEEVEVVKEPARAAVVADFIAVADEPEDEDYVDPDPDPEPIEEVDDEADDDDEVVALNDPELEESGFSSIPKRRPPGEAPWSTKESPKKYQVLEKPPSAQSGSSEQESETPKLKLGIKASASNNELSLDSAPRGRFEGESPNVVDGEDLDLPPFLRKKK